MPLPQVQRTGFEAYLPRMDLSMVAIPSRGVFYQTPLNATERAGFEAWRSQLPRYQQGTADYDLQGYYKDARNGTDPRAKLATGPYGAHLSDYRKLPFHSTMSDQSMYHGVDGWQGGSWIPLNKEETKWLFNVGATNRMPIGGFGRGGLIDYFHNNEKGNTFVDPRTHVLNSHNYNVVPKEWFNTANNAIQAVENYPELPSSDGLFLDALKNTARVISPYLPQRQEVKQPAVFVGIRG